MTNKSSDHKAEARRPRPIQIACGIMQDGRVAVTVSVEADEDLDAEGGVFVDVILAGRDRATRKAEKARATYPAIRSVSQVSVLANDPNRLRPLARPTQHSGPSAIARSYTPHLIAAGRTIATGKREKFHTEIVLAGNRRAGLSWFVRGRLASLGDDPNLRSGWVRVNNSESERMT